MIRTPLHQQVDTLPALVADMIDPLIAAARDTFTPALCQKVQRVFLTGCGDSHHAPLNAELAFEQLAGLPCEPMTAMQFSRYTAGFLPTGANLLLAVSVSGQVARTAEALRLGRLAGATAVALTGNPHGRLAAEAELILTTTIPPLPAEMAGLVVPGSRSYIASQLALFVCAIHLGQQRGHLKRKQANQLFGELAQMAALMEQTIAASDPVAGRIAQAWVDADQFIFCGAGPNYGTALFTAAKVLEASGDAAYGQDLEEWAHLQYFARETATPTFLISAGGWDEDRALEIATAARQIGRRVAVIAPQGSRLARLADLDEVLPTAVPLHECFSPLLLCLPGTLFAAYRAQVMQEPYFRGFGGGRALREGGGISRIQTSQQIHQLNQ